MPNPARAARAHVGMFVRPPSSAVARTFFSPLSLPTMPACDVNVDDDDDDVYIAIGRPTPRRCLRIVNMGVFRCGTNRFMTHWKTHFHPTHSLFFQRRPSPGNLYTVGRWHPATCCVCASAVRVCPPGESFLQPASPPPPPSFGRAPRPHLEGMPVEGLGTRSVRPPFVFFFPFRAGRRWLAALGNRGRVASRAAWSATIYG